MWTLTHAITIFPTFVVLFAFAFLIGHLLKGKSELVRTIPLQLIAMALILMELIKQVKALPDYANGNLYALPFHYCSLFLYILPLHSFCRVKPRPIIDALTVMLTASLFVNMFIMPANIYSADNIKNMFREYGSFHTVVFHNLVCLYGMLTISLKAYKMKLGRDILISLAFLSAYVVIATILSFSLDTNFHNLKECNIPFIGEFIVGLKTKLGGFGWIIQVIYDTLLFIATLIMGVISYLAMYGVDKLICLFSKKGEEKLMQKAE